MAGVVENVSLDSTEIIDMSVFVTNSPKNNDETEALLQDDVVNSNYVEDSVRGKIQQSHSENHEEKLIRNKQDLFILFGLMLSFYNAFCTFSIPAPILPLEVKKFGVSQTTYSQIFATYPLTVFLTSPVVGKLMPRVGVKFFLITGGFISGVSNILFGFLDDINATKTDVFVAFCFVLRVTTAIGVAMNETAALSILTVTFRHRLSTAQGLTSIFVGIGLMTGPTIGSTLFAAGGYNFKVPFLAIGGFLLIVIFVTAFILPPESEYHKSGDSNDQINKCSEKEDTCPGQNGSINGNETITEGISEGSSTGTCSGSSGVDKSADETIKKSGQFWKILFIPGISVMSTVTLVAGIVLAFFDATLTDYLIKIDPNLDEGLIGWIFMCTPLTYTIFTPIVGKLIDKKIIRGRTACILGTSTASILYLFIAPSPLIWFIKEPNIWITIVFLLLLGFSVAGMFLPVLSEMQLSARKSGLKMDISTDAILSSIYTSLFYVGNIIGTSCGGIITDKLKFPWSSTILAFLLLFEALVLVIYTIWDAKKSNRKYDKMIVEDKQCDNEGC